VESKHIYACTRIPKHVGLMICNFVLRFGSKVLILIFIIGEAVIE